MKMIIAAVGFLLAATAGAQELKFGDLNYFLKQGQFSLTADMNHGTYRFKTSPVGANTPSVTKQSEGYYLTTKYSYALTNRFNLFLGLNYQYDVINKVVGSNTERFNQDGLNNPVLGANFRLFNQETKGVNLDFGAVARIGVESAEVGTVGAVKGSKDGNAANGRNSLELNTRAGTKWNEANEWFVTAGVIYNKAGDYKIHTPNNGVNRDVDVESSWDSFVSAAYQYRPVNEFMMALSLTANRVDKIDSTETNSNSSMDENAHFDYEFAFNAKYLICENFIAKFNYGQSLLSDYDVEILGTETEIQNRHRRSFGLGVDFLF